MSGPRPTPARRSAAHDHAAQAPAQWRQRARSGRLNGVIGYVDIAVAGAGTTASFGDPGDLQGDDGPVWRAPLPGARSLASGGAADPGGGDKRGKRRANPGGNG